MYTSIRTLLAIALFSILYTPSNLSTSEAHSRNYSLCLQELDPEFSDSIFLEDKINNPDLKKCIYSTSYSYCLSHSPSALFSGIDEKLLRHIPPISTKCRCCIDSTIYYGYVDPRFKRYSTHVARQIKYTMLHPECRCYWPELSEEAVDVNNKAHELFQILCENTPLNTLLVDDSLMDKFRNTAFSTCSNQNLVELLIARQFRFSHYYRLCRDIEDFAKINFSENDLIEIKSSLDTILKELSTSFSCIYKNCLRLHPNQEIKTELDFTEMFLPNENDEEWHIESEEFYDKMPLTLPLYRSKTPIKEQRLFALNTRPLFKVEQGLFAKRTGQDNACFTLLKNLIHELYKDQKFYKQAKVKIPELECDFLENLTNELNKEVQYDPDGDLLAPKTSSLSSFSITVAKDLGQLPLKNDILNYFRYKIFNGSGTSYWGPKDKTDDTSYHSLLEFITLQTKSDYLASLWLAPKPLLMAIFQNELVVHDVIATRQKIYEALEQGDDRLVMNDELRKRFSNKLGDIDPQFIDFRINRIHPLP